jgi:stage V sporulation protein AD
MAKLKQGKQSIVFQQQPVIAAWASVAGKKEKMGPLGREFDMTRDDPHFGQDTWEQGEKRMQQLALRKLTDKAGIHLQELELLFSGDLLNQCICSSLSMRNTGIFRVFSNRRSCVEFPQCSHSIQPSVSSR